MGKTYQSCYALYQVLVRPKIEQWEAGVKIGEIRELTAEFGIYEPEYNFDIEDAERGRHVNIRGFFFDLDDQAEQKGWTADEKRLVDTALEQLCKQNPGHCWLYTVPPALKPWPTYDDMDEKMIAVFAEQAGLAGEALRYEIENENRGTVVNKLEDLIDEQAKAEELTAA